MGVREGGGMALSASVRLQHGASGSRWRGTFATRDEARVEGDFSFFLFKTKNESKKLAPKWSVLCSLINRSDLDS